MKFRRVIKIFYNTYHYKIMSGSDTRLCYEKNNMNTDTTKSLKDSMPKLYEI